MPKKLKLHLTKIEQMAKERAELMEKEYYSKYFALFEIATKFLRTQPVLLYGGSAINELMPEKLKIYKAQTLPDLDVFAVNAGKIARALVKTFKDHGYITASLSEALHPGTWKVYVHGLQIADITKISSFAYRRLFKSSVKSKDSGIQVVDPLFLRMSMHVILAQPGSMERWAKVYPRLANFYKVFPPKPCIPPKAKPNPVPEDLLHKIYAHVQSTNEVVFGAAEIEGVIRDVFPSNVPRVQLLTDGNVMESATALAKAVGPDYELQIGQEYLGDDFVGNHVFLTFRNQKLVAIFNTDMCFSYNMLHGLRIASIHTIISMYMAMLFSSYRHFDTMVEGIECMTNALTILQQTSVGSRKHILRQLVMECYGPAPGLVTMRRERFLRLMDRK